jgi:hypothetical protein
MNKDQMWQLLVNLSGSGLYKEGSLGREVHDFEIEAALDAQRLFAEMTDTDSIQITCIDFTTPPEGSTYRSMTEPIHRKMIDEPCVMESAWVNVWHSVVEASFLSLHGQRKERNNSFELVRILAEKSIEHIKGAAAYLAYCRECRDWNPSPLMFEELPRNEQEAWKKVEHFAASRMTEGFHELENGCKSGESS